MVQERLGGVGDVGFKQAMQQKWVGIDKSGGEPLVVRKVRAGRPKEGRPRTGLGMGGSLLGGAAQPCVPCAVVAVWRERLARGEQCVQSRQSRD